MGKPKKGKGTNARPPATTPEGRENQLISLAVDLAEEQLISGEASSQVITHFLKLGSSTDRIERDILVERKELLKAQTEAIHSTKKIEEMYKNALDAMRSYTGSGGEEDE